MALKRRDLFRYGGLGGGAGLLAGLISTTGRARDTYVAKDAAPAATRHSIASAIQRAVRTRRNTCRPHTSTRRRSIARTRPRRSWRRRQRAFTTST
jgi:hypothetical protein